MKYLILVLLSSFLLYSQQMVKNFSTEIYKNVIINYLLYLPKDYTEKNKYPMVLFLHGSGERGNDISLVEKHGLPKLIKQGKNFPFIIVSPQCKDNTIWNDNLEELYLLVEHIKSKYSVDDKRIYCTGLSMGGFGTWAMAIRYPNLFAAIAPVCGGGISWQASTIKHIPIWAFHGDKDEAVPIIYQQLMIDELKKYNSDVKFTVYPNGQHNIWDITYNTDDLYEWLLSKSKK